MEQLSDDITTLLNIAAQNGGNLCEITELLCILVLRVNQTHIGSLEEAADHVSEHMDKAYDILVNVGPPRPQRLH